MPRATRVLSTPRLRTPRSLRINVAPTSAVLEPHSTSSVRDPDNVPPHAVPHANSVAARNAIPIPHGSLADIPPIGGISACAETPPIGGFSGGAGREQPEARLCGARPERPYSTFTFAEQVEQQPMPTRPRLLGETCSATDPALLLDALQRLRSEAAAEVERLISLMDAIDADPDFEPSGDEAEPELGSTEGGSRRHALDQTAWASGIDGEPSLGSSENHAFPEWWQPHNDYVSRTFDGSQLGWATGNKDEREHCTDLEEDDSHDGREPDVDDELSGDETEPEFGSIECGPRQCALNQTSWSAGIDGEPSLGSSENHPHIPAWGPGDRYGRSITSNGNQIGWATDNSDDREFCTDIEEDDQHDGREPDVESEPSLGSINLTISGSQIGWAVGFSDDREDEHDGSESSGDETEPSLGAFDCLTNQEHGWRQTSGGRDWVMFTNSDAEVDIA